MTIAEDYVYVLVYTTDRKLVWGYAYQTNEDAQTVAARNFRLGSVEVQRLRMKHHGGERR